MNRFKEYRETTNSSVYNKLHKEVLERKGKIRCSRCKYHRGENDTREWYGYTGIARYVNYGKEPRTRYPNWKLVSKNKKQWMKKPLKKQYSPMKYDYYGREWLEFIW